MFSKEDIKQAIQTLKSGGVVLLEINTGWSLVGDAGSELAVEKIKQFTPPHVDRPLQLLFNSLDMLDRYAHNLPEVAFQLIEISDTPLSIVYNNLKNVGSFLLANDGSIALRVVDDTFLNELIVRLRRPLVSTLIPIDYKTVIEEQTPDNISISNQVVYIVKSNQVGFRVPKSLSILKFDSDGRFQILKH